MATFTGLDSLAVRRSGHLPGVSANLDGFSPLTWSGQSARKAAWPPAIAGHDADGRWQHVPLFTHWGAVGHLGWLNSVWDKVLVVPPSSDFGFVTGTLNFALEVWSSFRDRQQTLNGITVCGTGNLVLQAQSLPYLFEPGASLALPALMPGQGDPVIATVVAISFAGLQPVSSVFSGQRIFVFWPQPDWSSLPSETPQWKTEILKAVSGSEQRRKLRPVPRYQISYRVVSDTPKRTARLEAQIFAGQTSLWGIPFWPEASDLLTQAAAGARTLSVDTTDRPTFGVGGLVLLWRDPDAWEAVLVESVASQAVGLGAALERTWPAGTRVVPMRQGHMITELPLDRPNNWVTAAPFQFDCEIP